MDLKKLQKLIDCCFWWLVKLLPILSYGIYIIHKDISFSNFMLNNFGIINTNVFFTGLNALFGSSSVYLPIFNDTGILMFMAYYINILLLHIVVDYMIMLPQIVHDFSEKLTGGSK